MNILLVEPYLTGSHSAWASGYARHSRHNVEILSLPGRFWKWRMHGGAVTLARQLRESNREPDLILATDMLDVSTFLALIRSRYAHIPVATYFHENQIAYPWPSHDRDLQKERDHHYGFINYTSALVSDAVLFNSSYNRDSFLKGLRPLLKHFPDHNELGSIAEIRAKSHVLLLGLDLSPFDIHTTRNSGLPIILWNHRWEYDKNPEDFMSALQILAERKLEFQVVILGESFKNQPREIPRNLKKNILHCGYVNDFAAYAKWLWKADILPVTSTQDFFGASIVEAVYCRCYPLLPERLSYPELFPVRDYKTHYYEDLEDLVEKLTVCIQHIDEIRQTDLRSAVDQYDWAGMAPQYDRYMESIRADKA